MKTIHFDFIKNARFTILLSLALLLAGAFSMIVKGGLELGIDFAGGQNLRVKVENSIPMDAQKLRALFAGTDINPGITDIGEKDEQEFFVYFGSEANASEKVKAVFNEKIAKYEILSESFVGPKIGQEFRKIAIQATILILILILVYIGFRFELKFGIAAILALLHDVLISIGFISLLGYKFDIPLLAAIMTIIGYSLNDTIVIFDRIREESKNLHLDRHEYLLVVNKSISKSLNRTFLTSFTTLIALGALIVFGGVELEPMSIILFLGVIVGTYSSNFIASPILVLWEKLFYKPKKKKA